MGVPEVLAVRARTDLEAFAQHRAICQAHIDAAVTEIAVPFTVADVTVTGLSAVVLNGGPHLQVDGTGGGISWPVYVERPAMLAADPSGRWLDRTVEQADGRQRRELVELPAEAVGPGDRVAVAQRYRYDPAACLRSLLAGLRES